MYKVVISPSANADLFNALKYIAYELENQQAAARLADGIENCYTDLEVSLRRMNSVVIQSSVAWATADILWATILSSFA